MRLLYTRNDEWKGSQGQTAQHWAKYVFWCPACKEHHAYGEDWKFNGDMLKPTFSPSLLISWRDSGGEKRCHLFVRDGVIEYCSDSTHELRGKHVPMVDLDELVGR